MSADAAITLLLTGLMVLAGLMIGALAGSWACRGTLLVLLVVALAFDEQVRP